ncbi:hypothetical protein D3C71_1610720 [compost metagenome]
MVAAPVVNAPPILKMNTALESPCPSRVNVVATDPAAAMAYTPGNSVSPFPSTGPCITVGAMASISAHANSRSVRHCSVCALAICMVPITFEVSKPVMAPTLVPEFPVTFDMPVLPTAPLMV